MTLAQIWPNFSRLEHAFCYKPRCLYLVLNNQETIHFYFFMAELASKQVTLSILVFLGPRVFLSYSFSKNFCGIPQ